MLVPSNRITIRGFYSLQHNEHYDTIIGEEWYISFYNKSLGTFYRTIYSVRVCISDYVVRYRASSGGGNYIESGLRLETGIEKTTIIVDIFNIIQTERNTGVHLKVLIDEEEWRIAQGSKMRASGYGPHVCNLSALRLPDIFTLHGQ